MKIGFKEGFMATLGNAAASVLLLVVIFLGLAFLGWLTN